jgi:hypothetical protein
VTGAIDFRLAALLWSLAATLLAANFLVIFWSPISRQAVRCYRRFRERAGRGR